MLDADSQDFDPAVYDRLARDAPARRELIWLLAMIKGDHQHARELEGLDSGIRRRLAPLMAKTWHQLRRQGEGRGQGELYQRAFDQRFAHHAARYRAVSCACKECLPRR
ncbi:MAG: hypothetical protein IT377_08815 [Polyangiaceae bacterium]|nr:hypothetical protein [Polyangiaceae bacterium]